MGSVGEALMRRVGTWLKRLEALPEFQDRMRFDDRAGSISARARELAYSALDDESLRARLRSYIAGQDEYVTEAINQLATARDNFVDDRAYRLLAAAAENTPVRPIDPAMRDAFAAEEKLGRLPLKDAYRMLADREPRLVKVENDVTNGHRGRGHDDPAHHLPTYIRDHVEKLVGLTAKRHDPLLRSDLADSIAQRYLLILGGTPGYGDPRSSFFERPIRATISSSSSLGKKRPKARN